ncbi:MAG: hypothetical protein IJ736_09915 [Firmicutes bacterium]|nr:hypothetical protein [Bacillota bacterium]
MRKGINRSGVMKIFAASLLAVCSILSGCNNENVSSETQQNTSVYQESTSKVKEIKQKVL